MNTSFLAFVQRYWSLASVEVNLVVFANLLGALLLGLMVGYERSYHGRAAGMRTYGIVCMASAALTVFVGYPEYWWGVHAPVAGLISDPTRVVQGIVTGVGFLGAGVIMRDGLSISGLTTAASIWASSAIGILVGVGFYPAAILLAVLSASLMMWGSRLEMQLPSRRAVGATLTFAEGHEPDEARIKQAMSDWGYQLADGSLHIQSKPGHLSWQFVMVATCSEPSAATLFELDRHWRSVQGVHTVQLAYARN